MLLAGVLPDAAFSLFPSSFCGRSDMGVSKLDCLFEIFSKDFPGANFRPEKLFSTFSTLRLEQLLDLVHLLLIESVAGPGVSGFLGQYQAFPYQLIEHSLYFLCAPLNAFLQ